MIYKYAPCSEYTFNNLKNSVIHCRHYSRFNDPFEFWSVIEEGEPHPLREKKRYERALKAWGFETDYNDVVRDYFEEIKDYQVSFEEIFKRIRISCFSRDADNLLLWSHHADGLHGICLEFDEQELKRGDDRAEIVDVRYAEKPGYVDAFEYALAQDQIWFYDISYEENGELFLEERRRVSDIVNRTLISAFATKPIEWRYENECRLLMQNEQDQPAFYVYSDDALRRVIVGQRISDANRQKLESTLMEAGVSVPIAEATRKSDGYQLEISSLIDNQGSNAQE